jgi:hypothetical protein
MRKSFLIHIDSLKILEKMTDEQAGVFIKKIYEYQNTGSIKDLDFAMEMAIIPFLNQFERDNEKWKIKAEANKQNGSKGGRPKTQINQDNLDKPSGLFENPIEAKKGVNVNVSVNGNVNGNITNPLAQILDKKTPTPRGSGGVFKKIDLVGGVGVKLLKVIDVIGQLTGKDIQEIERLAAGWDIEHLAKVYVDGINSGSREAPRSIPKAFPQWCTKYTKGKRP